MCILIVQNVNQVIMLVTQQVKVDLGAAVTTVRIGTADDRTLDGGVVNVMCIQ